MKQVEFFSLEKGNQADYDLLFESFQSYNSDLPRRILKALTELKTSYEGYQISRYEHSLQTATRAHRNGETEEMVVAALVHDIGGTLSPYNHAAVAGIILRAYVSEKVSWIVEHHDIFSLYHWGQHWGLDQHAREQYKDHPYYQAAIDFCQNYDQKSFEPDYDTLPIEFFEPMVYRIFDRPRHNSPYLRGKQGAQF